MNYKKIEKIGKCTLYLGDSLEIMPHLPKVNCVMTDPPYKLTSGGKTGELGGILSVENYSNDGNIVECNIHWDDFMPLIADRVDRGHIYTMSNDKNMREMLNAGYNAGMHMHNILPWDKVIAVANKWWMKNYEFTVMHSMGKAFFLNDCGKKQGVRYPPKKVTDHPTEKPVALMQYYVENSTKKGDVVLDPFMGVGSTALACVNLGLDFIGIEIDEKWFDIACERIESANKQGSLF